ncbi:hypothetical protein PROFUN_05033 [Planoprotostelium fungivorum]|uniref:Uncharacterized protein n=1 Tax=Planoprotostelium fungivorum TaxID=1890364 RepID=A0A2P6NS83_9EUKA|nr:hypothetical protein PROFUN_05033 [Planoprotostelium fungivorum]
MGNQQQKGGEQPPVDEKTREERRNAAAAAAERRQHEAQNRGVQSGKGQLSQKLHSPQSGTHIPQTKEDGIVQDWKS